LGSRMPVSFLFLSFSSSPTSAMYIDKDYLPILAISMSNQDSSGVLHLSHPVTIFMTPSTTGSTMLGRMMHLAIRIS
jgi:hypothetical protein